MKIEGRYVSESVKSRKKSISVSADMSLRFKGPWKHCLPVGTVLLSCG